MPSFTAINGQIKTPLRWYNDEALMSFNTPHCCDNEGCDFAVWVPINRLLPFQFWRPQSAASIASWGIYNQSGALVLNLAADIGLLEIVPMATLDYVIYSGDVLSVILPQGIYHSRIVTDGITYYSELFRPMCTVLGTENIAVNGDFSDGLTGWTLGGDITVAIERETTPGTPSTPCTEDGTVIINTGDNLMYECEGGTWTPRTPADGRIFYVESTGTWDIFTGGSFSGHTPPPITVAVEELCWDGPEIVTVSFPLPPGPIYIFIRFGIAQGGTMAITGPGINEIVSGGYGVEYNINAQPGDQLLFTPSAGWEGCLVAVEIYQYSDEEDCHPKLEWTNCGNTGNTYYEDGFTNVLYLDKRSLPSMPTPRVVIEGEEDGQKNFVETMRRVEVEYRIDIGMIPWHLLDSIAKLSMHDTVRLTLPNSDGAAELMHVRIESARDEVGEECLAMATLVFQVDEAAVSTLCCTTFDPPCISPCETVAGFRDGITVYVEDGFYLTVNGRSYSQYKGFANGPVDADGFEDLIDCPDGLVEASFGDDPYLYWTGDEWFALAQITEILRDGCDNPVVITANMIARYAGQLQYSVDNGATWTNIGFPHNAAEWGSGVEVNDLPPACDLRIMVGVGDSCDFGTSATLPFDCCYAGSLCECVYYQDFRVWTDQMSARHAVSNFVVDGVVVAGDPQVPFITPDTFIDVDGRSFATNLIDTLNSLEVCGFSFFPHENLRPLDEGDTISRGGYFRMRYPCGVVWLIEIRNTSSGAPAYRYSSADGAQQWNGSAWVGFSYGGWSAGPGEECVTL